MANNFKKTYLSLSHEVPVVGSSMKNFIRINKDTEKRWERMKNTSYITEVRQLGIDTYEVHTMNSLYIVQVV